MPQRRGLELEEARRREALVIRTAVPMRGVLSTRARVQLPLDVRCVLTRGRHAIGVVCAARFGRGMPIMHTVCK